MQGAQILRNEAYREVRCSDEGCSATQKLNFLRSHQGVNEMESDLREKIADLNRTADEIRGRL
jgi:hypothetical protein